MPSDRKPRVLLLGVGCVGGSLLHALLATEAYQLTALVSLPEQVGVLEEMGVHAVLGSIDDEEFVFDLVVEHEVIIHTGCTGHESGIKMVMYSIARRPSGSRPPVFIYTSSAHRLLSGGKSSSMYSDEHPEHIDMLLWSKKGAAPSVELSIQREVYWDRVGKARVAIIAPGVIFGVGSGPFDRVSPSVRELINDLVSAYLTLLSGLLSNPPQTRYAFTQVEPRLWMSVPSLYFFAETGEHSRKEGQSVFTGLDGEEDAASETNACTAALERTKTAFRCRGDTLREWGWEGKQAESFVEGRARELELLAKENA
ncbi:hypothetical protein BCR35DRAFT_329088 [Leucosporidium creatinivorum]|uniref:NAD(P)-binding domain-containing protein n=1 Tax=Leucosporidium creatinivorum TaxID=106004 RepID=A0A1Y2G006_9BASI|nr:hypothetical protein BCR35DRAFT_329088 [Leucosporidium creatinivorum]